jgi:hypothetical protein
MAYTQVGDTCYPSELAANQAIASGQIGNIVAVGNNSYVVDSSTQDANSITYVLQRVNSTAVITKTATITPVPCQALTAEDAGSMAWMVVAAWIGVYGIMFLTRPFRDSKGDSYGSA